MKKKCFFLQDSESQGEHYHGIQTPDYTYEKVNESQGEHTHKEERDNSIPRNDEEEIDNSIQIKSDE